MKFGASLLQRSIPQWRSFNIDYASVKKLIKENTTPGQGKALSIPGQGDSVAEEFENHLFDVLNMEHDRVSMFVKSKCYEIDSRLSTIERQLVQLQKRRPEATAQRLAFQTRRKFSRIETDILAVGEQIHHLSRFITTNRTAIRKLLKKYRKWTGSTILVERLDRRVLSSGGSFTKISLNSELAQYAAYLDAVRSPFDRLTNGEVGQAQASPLPPTSTTMQCVSSAQSVSAQQTALDFDTALALPSRSRYAETASYWIHSENVVQLRILLLQHMRYVKLVNNGTQTPCSASSHQSATAKRREDEAGLIVLDNLSQHRNPDSISIAATALWTGSEEAVVCVPEADIPVAEVKQEYLASLIDISSQYAPGSDAQHDDQILGGTLDGKRSSDQEAVRGWLKEHKDVKPLACIKQQRSRFFGLDDASSQAIYATLDEEIEMGATSMKNLHSSNVFKYMGMETRFPHAVLNVRAEGNSKGLLSILDHSHLTERVLGFTTARHAIAACCKPTSTPPSWFSTLEKDIRHMPPFEANMSATLSRRSSNIGLTSATASPRRSFTTQSARIAPSTPPTSNGTKVPPPDLGKLVTDSVTPKSKQRRHPREQLPAQIPEQGKIKYWNEFDDGSEADDNDGFVIYVDPDAPMFPGLAKWTGSVRGFFRRGGKPEQQDPERQPLSPSTNGSSDALAMSTEESSSDETEIENDATPRAKKAPFAGHHGVKSKGYGTLMLTQPNSYPKSNLQAGTGQFRSQLQSLRPPQEVQEVHSHISTICMAASIILLSIISVLASTGRKKSRGKVDLAVLVGVVAALAFAMGGVLSLVRAREGAGVVRKVGVGAGFVGVCVWVGGIVAWVGL